MDRIEMEGETVEEAVDAALREMGRSREDVDIEVLVEGSRGLFGLGKKAAKVVVKLKEGGLLPPDAVERATKFLIEVVRRMGMDVEVEAKQIGNELYLEVDQGAGGILIGRHGTTLAALSYLMERIVSHSEDANVKVFVDVAGYLERRRRTLVTLAHETADQVKASGQPVELDAMSAFERKVVHTTLHDDATVRTFSRGEGEERRVVIVPASTPVSDEERDGGRGERGGRGGRWGGGGRGGRGRGDRQDRGAPRDSDRGGRDDRGGDPVAVGPEGVRDPGPLEDAGGGGYGGGGRGGDGGGR
ncbi:MAG: RNA-binding cell elongation regulator Jag/EloR, partial [Candidatus Coatesbacteria bacterium]